MDKWVKKAFDDLENSLVGLRQDVESGLEEAYEEGHKDGMEKQAEEGK